MNRQLDLRIAKGYDHNVEDDSKKMFYKAYTLPQKGVYWFSNRVE